ncbi:MAG: hypothetical protein QM756_07900 [Polyangiaceae bacterium]
MLGKDLPEQVPAVLAEIKRVQAMAGGYVELHALWVEAEWLVYSSAPLGRFEDCLGRMRKFDQGTASYVRFFRVWNASYQWRLVCAALFRTQGSERRAWLRRCEDLLRRLRREAWEPAEIQAHQVEATLAQATGDSVRAAALLERSAKLHARDGARIHASAARLAAARLLGDEARAHGHAEEIRSLRVVNPERSAYGVVPIFPVRS